MKYILYGANRISKDFMYMFDNIEYKFVVDDGKKGDSWNGLPYFCVDELEYLEKDDQIIICDVVKEKKEKKLNSKGFIYGEQYLYEEDFFESLDEWKMPNREIAVWGTGKVAQMLIDEKIVDNVSVYIDSYKAGSCFDNIQVVSPDRIENWKQYFVIIAVVRDDDICKELRKQGLLENVDFARYQTVTGLPSRLLRKTIFDTAYYELRCNTMLNHLEIFHNGDTRCCCTTFVKQNLDNMLQNTISEVWNSNLHKVLCLSTENRTYSFCDKTMCPLFVGKSVAEKGIEENTYKEMAVYPETLAVGYDSTCNLACSTCRDCIHVAQGEEKEIANHISEIIKEDYLKHCKFLIMAGDGEVFLSPAYRTIYSDKQCNPPYIRILTNGMLFNEKTWTKFKHEKTGKIMLTVSIDAATKETYEKIRRNGNFDILKRNMEFASTLRKNGELRYFRLNFVVQRDNYQEMPLFVRWGKELHVDEIFFTKILNWGTYTDEKFKEVSMMELDGITPKEELLDVMNTPEMHEDIVDMGTIQYGHKIDETECVENYYMWELEKRGGIIFD